MDGFLTTSVVLPPDSEIVAPFSEYVHDLAFMPRESVMSSTEGDASVHSAVTNERSCHAPCLRVGRLGSVPFVSDRPGAYGRLLLEV